MTAKKLVRVQILLSLICCIVIICGTFAIYHWGGFKRVDNIFYDLHFRWRGPIPTSGKVVLVLMDDQSAVKLKRKRGQWSRKQTAQALLNLKSAGAEIIGLDMIMADPDPDPAADKELAKAFYECNNIILARVSATQSGSDRSSIPLLRSEMIGEGFIDVPLDSDDVWRRLRYFNVKPMTDGSLQVHSSFALELARIYLYIDLIVDSSDKQYLKVGTPQKYILLPRPELLINFYGNYSAFPTLSYYDVVKNNFDPQIVKGNIVIIGSSLVVNKDKYSTPFSLYHGLSGEFENKFKNIIQEGLFEKDLGVACQAHALETILSQKFLIPLTKHKLFVLILLCGILGTFFYIPILSGLWDYLVLGMILGSIIITGYFAFLKYYLVIETTPLIIVTILQFITGIVLQKAFAKKRTSMVTDLFGKYVSNNVVNKLINGDIDISFDGQQQEVTILFTDINGFTTLSEKIGAKATSKLLNTYFGAMIPIVFKHQGTLDKLMGDAVMAFFGAPIPVPDHPIKAARTALDMLEKLEQLNKTFQSEGIGKLNIGIGINTGSATVGNLGSQNFIDYTVIGDSINIGSRLEKLKKIYSTRIIVSEFTASKLNDEFLLRELDRVKVRGKSTSIKIYELCCYKKDATPEKIQMISLFESGLSLFHKGKWQEAKQFFNQTIELIPDDGPSTLFLDRIVKNEQSSHTI